MKRLLAFAGTVLVLTSGCASLNKQPTMRNAVVQPSVLKPGESATITVKVDDRHKIVNRVVAIAKDYPQMKLPLRDDGQVYDVEAGDGVWTAGIDVDFMAPPGEFELVIAAFRSDGEPIVVNTKDKGDAPLAVSAKVTVEYASQELPPDQVPEPIVEPPAPGDASRPEASSTP